MSKRIVDNKYLDDWFPPDTIQYHEFETRIFNMLDEVAKEEEELYMRKKSIWVMILAAVLAIAFACTALAVASRFNILSEIFPRSIMQEDVENKYVIRSIIQEGGELANVRFTIREAVYDGHNVHFIITAEPKTENFFPVYVLCMEDEVLYQDAMKKANVNQSTTMILGVYCEAAILSDGEIIHDGAIDLFYVPYAAGYNGNTYYCVYDAILPSGISPDKLTIQCSIGSALRYADYADGNHEKGNMTFELPKTGEVTVADIDVNIDFHGSFLEHITLTHTPIELSIKMTGTGDPQIAHHHYMLIREDGVPYGFTRSEGDVDSAGNLLFTGSFAAESDMPEKLILWRSGTNFALVINVVTGDASIHPADIMADRRIVVHMDEPL